MEIARPLSDLIVVLVFFVIATAPKLINMYIAIRKGNNPMKTNESNQKGLSLRSGSLATRRLPFRSGSLATRRSRFRSSSLATRRSRFRSSSLATRRSPFR